MERLRFRKRARACRPVEIPVGNWGIFVECAGYHVGGSFEPAALSFKFLVASSFRIHSARVLTHFNGRPELLSMEIVTARLQGHPGPLHDCFGNIRM